MFYLNPFKAVVLRGRWVLFVHMTLTSKRLQDRLITLAFGQTIFSYCSKLGLNAYSCKAASGLFGSTGKLNIYLLITKENKRFHFCIFVFSVFLGKDVLLFFSK